MTFLLKPITSLASLLSVPLKQPSQQSVYSAFQLQRKNTGQVLTLIFWEDFTSGPPSLWTFPLPLAFLLPSSLLESPLTFVFPSSCDQHLSCSPKCLTFCSSSGLLAQQPYLPLCAFLGWFHTHITSTLTVLGPWLTSPDSFPLASLVSRGQLNLFVYCSLKFSNMEPLSFTLITPGWSSFSIVWGPNE